MLDTKQKALHAHPSLLPLRMALIAAGNGVSSSPDINEQRAQILIAKMKTEYKKPLPFTSWKSADILNSFNLQEVIGNNV